MDDISSYWISTYYFPPKMFAKHNAHGISFKDVMQNSEVERVTAQLENGEMDVNTIPEYLKNKIDPKILLDAQKEAQERNVENLIEIREAEKLKAEEAKKAFFEASTSISNLYSVMDDFNNSIKDPELKKKSEEQDKELKDSQI
jgi:hypothetical protein